MHGSRLMRIGLARARLRWASVVAVLAMMLICVGSGIAVPAARASSEPGGMPLYRVAKKDMLNGLRTFGGEAADFDNDGDIDLLMVISTTVEDPDGPSRLALLVNDGDANFSIGQVVADPWPWPSVYQLAVEDFDGDGWVDAAVPGAAGVVAIFLNDGAGGLVTGQEYDVGSVAWCTTAGDFDGDGVLDIAVSRATNLVWLRGIGAGVFAAAGPIAGPTGATNFMDASDLDGDGMDELVTWSKGIVRQFWRDAAGTWTEGPQFSMVDNQSWSGGVRLGDLNGDGAPDVVASSGWTTSVLRNDGFGTLKPGASVDGYVLQPDIADLNGDGAADFTISLGISINAGHDAFRDSSLMMRKEVYLNTAPVRMIARDFDGDGVVDLLSVGGPFGYVEEVGGTQWGSAMTMLQATRQHMGAPSPPAASTAPMQDIQVGDIDADGADDLVVGPWVVFGGPRGEITVLGSEYYTHSSGLGDVDSDGDLDIVVPTDDGYVLRQFDGAGFTDTPVNMEGGALLASLGQFVADGPIDLFLRGALNTFLEGGGSASFKPTAQAELPMTGSFMLRTLDLDGDGIDEVLHPTLGACNIFSTDGAGGLAITSVPSSGGWDAATGDFHTDIGEEYVTSKMNMLQLRAFGGDPGDIGLLEEAVYNMNGVGFGIYSSQFRVSGGDVDGDGAMDLLGVGYQGQAVLVGLCEGAALPDIMQLIALPGPVIRTPRAGDFNGDGVGDVAYIEMGGEYPLRFLWGSTPLESPVECTPDLDASGAIDSADLNALLADFGCTSSLCSADIDADGDTDSADLNLLLATFGTACP